MDEELITKYLKLPFKFEAVKLLKDLKTIENFDWTAHFNTSGYKGEWKVIPLYAPNGDPNDIFALSTSEGEIMETPVMKQAAYFKEIISEFHCPISSVRLLKLGIGGEIKPHKDHELGYEDGTFRLHIPISTNTDVRFILDGELLTMLPGECWYTNVNYEHAVSNHGDCDRVHLVIDLIRNDWTDELFFSLAPEASFFPKQEQMLPPELIGRMIEELTQLNNPLFKEHIDRLKSKLKHSQ